VEEVFEFVQDDCDLAIEALEAVAAGDPAPAEEPAADAPAPLPPAETVAARAELPPPVAATVRVDVAKVDRLVNLVGELVINQAMLVQLGGTLPPDLCPGLVAGLETLSQHLRELQEGVMAIRTQPVKTVFSRMPRLVRELSAQLGKEVRLVVTGEATEIDKTVVEQLADPLTHLLRNALDHGIEPPEQREAAGKPRQGTIHLGAEQRSGRIVIELADDGRGIDRPRVLARAKERGLVPAEAQLTDAEIDELIFLPSFSTAATVSAVSGRGVGMDVVRRNIQALGGRITLESRAGQGSRFLLSLPLTLAVLDGLVVAVGREGYILPISAIVESLRPRREDIHAVVGRGEVLAIRGAYIPLLRLHDRFGVAGAVTDPWRGIVVIVETDNAGRLGLVVDDLIGQQQVVVKSLEANYGPVEGIGGATILGDGRVALILDIAGLAAALRPAHRAAPAPALQ
jgi:two-component system chemotaxis sensor kinase CheA